MLSATFRCAIAPGSAAGLRTGVALLPRVSTATTTSSSSSTTTTWPSVGGMHPSPGQHAGPLGCMDHPQRRHMRTSIQSLAVPPLLPGPRTSCVRLRHSLLNQHPAPRHTLPHPSGFARLTLTPPLPTVSHGRRLSTFSPSSFRRRGPELFHNPTVATCTDHAARFEPGTIILPSGATVAYSGAKTGRSPADKRIIEDAHAKNVWWGPVNMKLSMESFEASRKRALDFLDKRDKIYIVDGYAGWDLRHRLKIRVICSRAYHALFMSNMLIKPTAQELASFGEPDFTIYNAGQRLADPSVDGITSTASVQISFERKEMVILGTEYAGEMKKGVFTVMHYLMPLNNVLSLHASANEGIHEKDVSLFFGLSGTGKTTLSADSHRRLIGDDEHCWTDTGVFNIEGGCYAKAINLSSEKEPEIFSTIRTGAVLENVVVNQVTGKVDFDDATYTENTRLCYPINYIPNAKIPCVGGHPKNIILLTCDAFGVLPPVSRLTTEQAMYHFLSGYTAKVSGTEQGVTEPEATFSACFGQPFLVWHPTKYAAMLSENLERHGSTVWLVNTGWTGGKFGVGKRIALDTSRRIVDAIHSGTLTKQLDVDSTLFPTFDLQIPLHVPGVPDSVLDPRSAWGHSNRAAFEAQLEKLKLMFDKNYEKFA